MSVATLTAINERQPTFPLSLEVTLRDYAIQYSSTETESDSNLEIATSPPSASPNPPNWPTEYRRIPPYRPINRNLDLSERPNGSNTAELLFVTVMMNGVRLQAGLVRLWEKSGGRWYPGLTRYDIGGEW